jgi:ABC-type amino acid transport substrate-binding protein
MLNLTTLKNFLFWSASHPLLSLPVAFLLSVLLIVWIGASVHEMIKKSKAAIGAFNGRQLVTIIACVSGLAAIVALVAPQLGVQLRVGPTITTPRGAVLSRDFVVRWQYENTEGVSVRYNILLTDKHTGKTSELHTNNLYEHIRQHGDLEIAVEAVLPNDERRRGKSINFQVYGDSVERIRSTQELVAAVHSDDDDGGLFCFPTRDSRDYQGFDIDLVDKLAEALRGQYGLATLRVKHKSVPWPDVIFRPNQWDVDLAIASITINSDRRKQVVFSVPYWETRIAVVQSHGVSGAAFQPEEFEHLRVAVHRGTTAEELMKAIHGHLPSVAEPLVVDDNPGLFETLSSNRADAVVYDLDRTYVEQQNHPDWSVRPIDYAGLARIQMHWKPEQYGIAFAPVNQQLGKDIDAILRRPELDVRGLMENRRIRFPVLTDAGHGAK